MSNRPFDCRVFHTFVDPQAMLPSDLARSLSQEKDPMGSLLLQVPGVGKRVVDYLEKRDGTNGSVFVGTNAVSDRLRGVVPLSMSAALCIVRYARLCGVAFHDQGRSRENSLVFYLGHGYESLPVNSVVTFSFRAANGEEIILANVALPLDGT